MNRFEKWREHLKSFAVGALLLVLICLCIVYILSFSGAEEFEFSADDMEAVRSESVRYQYIDYWNDAIASPSFIGFSTKNLGENIGFYTLGGENAEVYQSILPFFEKLFGNEGETKKLSSEEGERLFHALLRGDYIYVSYICDLPTSLIFSMTSEMAIFSGDSGEYISEILIVPDEYLWKKETIGPSGEATETTLYSFYAVARDTAGNYYHYSTEFLPTGPEDIAFHTNFYLTYNKADNRFPYEFACLWKQDTFMQENAFSEKVTDTTVIPLSGASHTSPVVFAESRIAGGSDMNAILECFFMNPEKVTSYTDENGVVFYFDEGQNLSVAPNGVLNFFSHDAEGIPLETLFGWHGEEKKYDVFDYLGAALIASYRLRQAHTQTNCALYISGIYYNGTDLKVCFGYSVAGFPLYFNGEKDILSFTFSAGTLKSAEYRFWTVHMTAHISELPDVLWTLRSYILTEETPKHYFYGYYFSKNQSRGGAEILKTPS